MSGYVWFVVLFHLIVEARLEATFQLTRGLQDKFTNPHCANTTACTVAQCARYFARCETDVCSICVCDEQSPTYVASEGRCVKDEDIFPPTVPKYNSFAIASTNGQLYMTADTITNSLDHETKYTGRPNQLWLYTTSNKLMNLKTLECLDFGYQDTVTLRQCTVDNNVTQMWQCKNDSDGLYGVYDGKKSYLDFTGNHFYIGDTQVFFKWVASKGNGVRTRAVCDIPDTYKGCYRFVNGFVVKRFSPKAQLKDCKAKNDDKCYESYSISAPIFSGDGHTSNCSIKWDASMFSVNDQPWKEFWMQDNNFRSRGSVVRPQVIKFTFNEKAKTVWAGALMKLEVECHDNNPFTQKKTYENHCILLKFDGAFNASLLEHMPTKQSVPTPLKRDSRYKSAVIALSIVLALVMLLAFVAAVLVLYRRRNAARTWFTANTDDDVTAKPFCNTDENF